LDGFDEDWLIRVIDVDEEIPAQNHIEPRFFLTVNQVMFLERDEIPNWGFEANTPSFSVMY